MCVCVGERECACVLQLPRIGVGVGQPRAFNYLIDLQHPFAFPLLGFTSLHIATVIIHPSM
jgi:hypothetical protein